MVLRALHRHSVVELGRACPVQRTTMLPQMRGGRLASFTGGEIGAAAVTPDPLLLLRQQGSLGDEDLVLGCPVETDPLPFYLFIYQLFGHPNLRCVGDRGLVLIAMVTTVTVALVWCIE